VAAAIGASGWVAVILAGAMLLHRGWLRVDRGFGLRLLRIAAATAMMGIALAVLQALLEIHIGPGLSSPARLAILAVLTTSGLAVYVTALHLLGVLRFHDLVAGLRGRS
jgi:peptidoglycan biosynthesis protein MviN/MurJ (putative lipid II flippase)